MAPWIAVVEAWLVQRLLRSPTFHSGVRRVHKNIHRLRHGPLEEDLGGTNIEKQGPGFASHFWEELQTQAGRRKNIQDPMQRHQQPSASQPKPKPDQPAQEPQPPKEGFISHFLDELRSQARGGDKNR